MNETLSLFDQPELDEHLEFPAPQKGASKPKQQEFISLADLPLAHPYTRYGLAVALYSAKLRPENLEENSLRVALADALENGLENFRMRTDTEPLLERLLTFAPVSLATLQAKPNWIQSAGLASQGIYIFPTVVTTDGDAKGTFENAAAMIQSLRDGDASDSSRKYSRSFAPTTAKINNGTASQSEPKGTLLETACAAIATLTPLKPASLSERNTAIIPDIPLAEMLNFVELFERMTLTQLDGNLMQAQLPPLVLIKPVNETKADAKAKAKAEAKPKSDYRRPRLHNGNYPFAPRDSAVFGAVGLLGAIGRWAVAANEVDRGKRVLESLADAPLYIVSYDKISQVTFGHHVVSLSIEAHLSQMLDALYFETQLYADIDSARTNRQSPAYQLFYLQASRFLQSFSPASFRDFLAARAEYPSALEPLFREFFLNTMNISPEVVNSAGVLGQWLNRTAYFVADGEVEGKGNNPERTSKVRKAKAKILVEFESAAMSAKDPLDMLFRISTRAGRLLQDDLPSDAKAFMDAVATQQIEPQKAVWLLVAYMRLRAPKKETGEAVAPEPESSLAAELDD